MSEIIEHQNHYILTLKGDIVSERYPKIIEILKELVDAKKHLIINFSFINSFDESFVHFLGTVKFLLSDLKKNVTLIYIPEKIEKGLDEHWKETFVIKNSLYESLHFIKENTIFPPISFLKNLVGIFMSSLLFDYSFPTSREKVFIKENHKDETLKGNFCGDKTASTLLMSDEVFFHFAISFTNPALAMIRESGAFDPLTFTRENVTKILEKYPHLKLKIVEQIGETLLEKKINKQPVFFNDEQFKLFDKGLTVVIPLDSFHGEIFFEFWIPDKFEKNVLAVINS